MRFNKLYIKLFLCFVAVLIVAEILIFGLFVVAVGRPVKERFYQDAAVKASLLKTVFEQRFPSSGDSSPLESPDLDGFISDFEGILDARIRLTSDNGNIVSQSFPEALPEETTSRLRRTHTAGNFDDIRIHGRRGQGAGIHLTIPVDLEGGTSGTMHVQFKRTGLPHPERGFAFGLALIGAVIALCVIPVSRLITKRVKNLQLSALQIAKGDLAHRSQVKGRDEIGDLGQAFNTMAAKLEQMIRSTRELTANVSHELRSPLARIRVAQELLQDRLENNRTEGTLNHLEVIQEEVELLDGLISRILTLSRMDFQEEPLRMLKLDFTELVRGVAKRFRPAMLKRGLRFDEKLNDTTTLITGDAAALETAVTNLVDNAFRYTPAEGRVTLELAEEAKGVFLAVTNTCDPIRDDQLERLFEPFHRITPGCSSGSGLGLAITKRIVDCHGGCVDARHMEGKLTISLFLPSDEPSTDPAL